MTTTNKDAATERPWFLRQAGETGRRGENYEWIADSDERGRHKKIIVSRDACSPADYALIVEAVNSYDALRAALKAALSYLDNSDSPGGCNGKHPECGHCAAIAKARAALGKATS